MKEKNLLACKNEGNYFTQNPQNMNTYSYKNIFNYSYIPIKKYVNPKYKNG
jgi:hypothetical protein